MTNTELKIAYEKLLVTFKTGTFRHLCNYIDDKELREDFKNRLLNMDKELFETTIPYQYGTPIKEAIKENHAFWDAKDIGNREKFLKQIIESL